MIGKASDHLAIRSSGVRRQPMSQNTGWAACLESGRMIAKHIELRNRTKQFSFRVIRLFKKLPHTGDAEVIGKQLLRCSTSVAANYRAVGRCRTKAEFANKLRIVLEEADEAVYWLECIREAGLFRSDLLAPLEKEAN